MYRVRFHGRGGQGMKVASRILGNAFFAEGYEVQDAPRYGAERRGAPIFAYVRAARRKIDERGVITCPDLVVIADETLVPLPAAGVLQGLTATTVVLINSDEPGTVWRERLKIDARIVTLPVFDVVKEREELPYISAMCAGAAARLVGVVRRESLHRAIEQEIALFGAGALAANVTQALRAFYALAPYAGLVKESADRPSVGDTPPQWIELSAESSEVAAPDIRAVATSVQSRTGLWRTTRPVIDYARCNRCSWICSTFCPDSAIAVEPDHTPRIDYDHCKGCLVCVAVCPPHAIAATPEHPPQRDATCRVSS